MTWLLGTLTHIIASIVVAITPFILVNAIYYLVRQYQNYRNEIHDKITK
jgi:hypothetical protein